MAIENSIELFDNELLQAAGSIEHLVFIGDDNQFNRVDKRLLTKAAALALQH